MCAMKRPNATVNWGYPRVRRVSHALVLWVSWTSLSPPNVSALYIHFPFQSEHVVTNPPPCPPAISLSAKANDGQSLQTGDPVPFLIGPTSAVRVALPISGALRKLTKSPHLQSDEN
ncbi:hypothetical protein B0T10DRAFT_221144 [Thelonectria olida]|uniref:Uncharacterized protein n=1 Tax=Thelonectria olida TaxID=1576542 RepID=A0A9P9AQW0_9HYPO|nr:hypothetical protein B0T10DRAFT_221144 [Thelonectria olida]